MKREIANGNYLRITTYAVNGLSEVTVELRDDGEDEVSCVVENGILYVSKNNEIVLSTNLFRVVFRDKT